MSTSFDPNLILHQELGELEDDYTLVPADNYAASIDTGENGVVIRAGSRDDGTNYYLCTINWKHVNPDKDLLAALQKDQVFSRQSFFLDIDEENKGLERGPNKNVPLGKLKAALGLDDDASIAELRGKGPALITVSHRVNKKTNEPTAEVTRVIPMDTVDEDDD